MESLNLCRDMAKVNINFGSIRVETMDFGLIPSERSLEAIGDSVRVYIIDKSKGFDLFPRTHKGKNRCVLRQKLDIVNNG